jgi:hypothetical protein
MYTNFGQSELMIRALSADDLSVISDDEELVQQPVEDNACEGVHCIALFKPCAEGYRDADPCCPNTGNCIPDPYYAGVAKPALPIGQTPSTELTTYRSNVVIDYPDSQFDQTTPIAIAMRDYSTQLDERIRSGSVSLTPPESQYTLLDTPSTTKTTTPEKPKEGGLGILAIGLIALKVLAT